MKKLYLFLSSLLLLSLFSGTAYAQINNIGQKLTSADELEEGKAYVIKQTGEGNTLQGYLNETSTNAVHVNNLTEAELIALGEEGNAYIFTCKKGYLLPDMQLGEYKYFTASSGNALVPATDNYGEVVTSSLPDVFSFKFISVDGASRKFYFCASTTKDYYFYAEAQSYGGSTIVLKSEEPLSDGSMPLTGQFEIYPVNDNSLLSVNVECKLTTQGGAVKTFKDETVYVRVGGVISAEEYPFMALTSDASVTIAEDTKTVTFSYQENLPFLVSESYENAKWYAIDINSSVDSYMWKNAGLGCQVEAEVTRYDLPTVPEDEKLWCFMGDLADGIKIYNKAAGANATLTYGTGFRYPMLEAEDDTEEVDDDAEENDVNNLWGLTTGTYDNSASFCVFGNERLIIKLGSGALSSYNTTSGDLTSCRFNPCATFVYNYIEACQRTFETAGLGALGTSDYFKTSISSMYVEYALESFKDPFTVTALMAMVAKGLEDGMIPTDITDNGVYVLVNTQSNGCFTVGNEMGKPITLTTAQTTARGNIPSFVILEPTGDGKYYLKAQGAYLAATADKMVENKSEAAIVDVEYRDAALFTLLNTAGTSSQYLQTDGNGTLNQDTYKTDNALWHLVPITKYQLNMGRLYDGKSYATRCFPFAVKMPNSELIAYVAKEATDSELMLENIRKGDTSTEYVLPANTPVLFMGSSQVEDFLIVTDDNSTYEGENNFRGTLFTEIVDKDLKAYILSIKTGDAAPMLYPLTTAETEADMEKRRVAANRAYYVYNGTQDAAAPKLTMKFRDVVSGIETVTEAGAAANDGDDVYYDLNGHRVLYPAHGIYVTKSGKKVILK